MGIFSRTRDIIAANVTDLLDKAEDPAKMIRMIILEMEETLVEVRASAARTIADQKEMRRQIAKLDRLQESWAEKAELALSKDREDLAKAASGREAEGGRHGRPAQGRDRGARRCAARVRGRHRQAPEQAARGPHPPERDHDPAGKRPQPRPAARDVFRPEGRRGLLALRRARAPRRPAEGHADALALGAPPKTLDEEIAELRNAEKVDAELEALKAKLAGAPMAAKPRRAESHGRRSCDPDRRRSASLFIGLPWLIFHYITKWKTRGDADHRGREPARRAARPRPPARRPDVHDRADHDRPRIPTGARSACDPVETGIEDRSSALRAASAPTAREEDRTMSARAHQILPRQAERQMAGRLRRDRRLYRHRRHPRPHRLRRSLHRPRPGLRRSSPTSIIAWMAPTQAARALRARLREEKKFWQGVRASPRARPSATCARASATSTAGSPTSRPM